MDPVNAPSRPPAGGALRLFVAATPVAGSLLFPLVVPLLMVRVGIGAGVLAAVVIGTLWFAAMLRTSEMPGHH
ncbi:hypothetical protein NZK33_18940 [Cyanobium sp. FGCU-6]|jgi:hypothetical protein|nr:hypothetical protein [Cyanobium sp. FGCU6]